jgi:hypothetical protein
MGASASVVRRKDLKKKRRLTDQQLLDDAMRQAERWKERSRWQ